MYQKPTTKYLRTKWAEQKTLRAGPEISAWLTPLVDNIQMCWLTSKTVKSLLNLLVFVINVASSMELLSDFQISCAVSVLI